MPAPAENQDTDSSPPWILTAPGIRGALPAGSGSYQRPLQEAEDPQPLFQTEQSQKEICFILYMQGYT